METTRHNNEQPLLEVSDAVVLRDGRPILVLEHLRVEAGRSASRSSDPTAPASPR